MAAIPSWKSHTGLKPSASRIARLSTINDDVSRLTAGPRPVRRPASCSSAVGTGTRRGGRPSAAAIARASSGEETGRSSLTTNVLPVAAGCSTAKPDRRDEIVDANEAAPIVDRRERKRNAAIDQPHQRREVALDAGAVHERRTQDDVLRIRSCTRRGEALLRFELGDSISIFRSGRVRFAEARSVTDLAIDFNAAQEDDAANLRCHGLARESLGSGDIDAPIGIERVLCAIVHDMRAGGEVDDDRDAAQRRRPIGFGPDVSDRNVRAREIQRSGIGANSAAHRQSGARELCAQRLPDETVRPGDEDVSPHRVLSLLRRRFGNLAVGGTQRRAARASAAT